MPRCYFTLPRSKKVVYRHLSVQIGDEDEAPWTVERAMDEFFSPEKLELKCEKCPCGSAQKELRISKKPKALIVHFKRFLVKITAAEPAVAAKPADKENAKSNLGAKFGGDDESEDFIPPLEDPEPKPEASPPPPVDISFHKNKACVALQRSITLDRLCKVDDMNANEMNANGSSVVAGRPAAVSGPHNYDAYAVIEHIGSTAESGHYTASSIRTTLFNRINSPLA